MATVKTKGSKGKRGKGSAEAKPPTDETTAPQDAEAGAGELANDEIDEDPPESDDEDEADDDDDDDAADDEAADATAVAGLRAMKAAKKAPAIPKPVAGAYVPTTSIMYASGGTLKTEHPFRVERVVKNGKAREKRVPNVLTDIGLEDVAQFLKTGAITEHRA